ncbi:MULTISPECIES: GNAT family N-acetyltransferase [Cellulomonas]|uniref:GNAT family N-acetyltransferase n=1 Tax=Cellulomonas TaxID=1707 RepID=UPI0010A75F9F|nr:MULTISPECIES: GNAT family N-acetyltransferase [Cellulomonas]
MSDVVVTDVPEDQRFEARTPDGDLLGVAVYRVQGDDVVLTHTEVDPEVEGRGVGSTLVRGALDRLRAQGRGVVAECPFVRSWVEEHPEYQDLLTGH